MPACEMYAQCPDEMIGAQMPRYQKGSHIFQKGKYITPQLVEIKHLHTVEYVLWHFYLFRMNRS